MVTRRKDTKKALMASAVHLVSKHGVEGGTTRAIAQETGVTEGAIYRHYRSLDELRWQAYKDIVEQMIQEKQHLLAASSPFRDTVREWIRLTYMYFDRHPEAFTYALLLVPAPVPDTDWQITIQQGQLFRRLVEQAITEGEIRDIAPELALCHFSGLMLNIPRSINEGKLEGPAAQYVDEAADAVWATLRPR